jgi:uncharacterized protein YegL
MRKLFFRKETTQGHKCKTKHLNKHFTQIAMVIDFTQLEGKSFAQFFFLCSSSFLKGSLIVKNIDIAQPNTNRFF